MRANEAALAALDAEIGFPDRHLIGDVALFPGRRADGKVPSAGIALTGISSPSPSSILAVTRRTNSGASSGTIFARSRVLVAIAGTGTSCNRASVHRRPHNFCR